jgi:hypothetical protein
MGLFDVFSSGPQEEAARLRQAALEKGYQQYSDLTGQGRDALQTNYAAALQPYQGLQPTAQAGYGLYGDVTGAGGAAGQDRARALFQTDPGYEFTRDQGLDAINRTGVARGGAVGNTMADAGKYATGLASQQYGDWVSRLAPWLGQGQQTASGIAGINTGLGNQLAGSYGQQGQAALGTQQGIGQAQSDAALAPYNASANLWNFGLNAAKTAASFIPGGGGGMQMPGRGPYPKLFG